MRSPFRPRLWLVAGCTLLWSAAAVAAAPLAVQDVRLQAEPFQLWPTVWEGRPALAATTFPDPKHGAPAPRLYVLRLEADGLKPVAQWALPEGAGSVQPVRLPGGETGWLGWIEGGWWLGRLRGDALAWHPLCECPGALRFAGWPRRFDGRAVFDLNGDGVDELVLADRAYLTAYRLLPPEMAAVPEWRLAWNPEHRPLPEGTPFDDAPAYGFQDADGSGDPELVIELPDRLRVAPLPVDRTAVTYRLDTAAVRTVRDAAPEGLADAIDTLRGLSFPGAEALLRALRASRPEGLPDEWLPHLTALLEAARDPLPLGIPQDARLEGLRIGKDDEAFILSHADMNGDGVLDVLHALFTDKGDIFGQENHLRWYRGRIERGRLAFSTPQREFKGDAGSFAIVYWPRVQPGGRPALLAGFAEIGFGSVMKALATGSATLELQVLPFAANGLADRPTQRSEVTFERLKDKGRRVMVLAADFNGDGWRDLALNPDPDTLVVHLSHGGAARLGDPAVQVPHLPLPSRDRFVERADLDGDGREELLMWYRESDHPQLAGLLRVVRMKGE